MRRSVQPLIAALLVVAAYAAPAFAAGRNRAHAPGVVGLVQLPGGGTLIHVRGTHGRAFVLSPDIVAAVAVRDLDADGNPDIVASSGRGLVVWRNLGAGRYVRLRPPSRRPFHRHAGPGISSSRPLSAQGVGFDEQRQQLAANRIAVAAYAVPTISSTPWSPTVARSAPSHTHAGRAPPVSAC